MSGYGVDTWCGESLVVGRLSRGSVTVALAVFRRLITERGQLRYGDGAASYGLDVAGYVGSVGTDAAVAALPALIRAEVLKDDRVLDVDVVASAVSTDPGGLTQLRLELSGVLEDAETPFALTLDVSSVGVEIVRLS